MYIENTQHFDNLQHVVNQDIIQTIFSLRESPRFSTEIGAFVVEKRLIPRREKYAVFNCLLIRSLCKLLFVLNFQLLKPAILFLFGDFYC